MKLGLIRSGASFGLVLFAIAACGQGASDEATASNVDAITTDGFTDEDFDGADLDGLGPDTEPMMTDEEIDALDDHTDEEDDAEAEALMASSDPFDDDVTGETDALIAKKSVGGVTAPPKVRCKKRLHATFAIYTYLTKDLKSNGCWAPARTTQDSNFRECHSDGDVKDPKGTDFFYDDTNPSNPLKSERARVAHCAKGEALGFEYMAFRDARWRIVRAPHVAAYYAELYTDDTRIDNLWYDSGVYRGNRALKKYARVAPMLNVAPYPARYSMKTIEKEILKVCEHVKNHGFIGLYEWHFPLDHDSPYVNAIVGALNRCTRK